MNRTILVVASSTWPLGPLFQFFQVASHLASRGFDLHVVSLQRGAQPSSLVPGASITFHHRSDKARNLNLNQLLGPIINSLRPAIVHNWLAGWRVSRWLVRQHLRWINTECDPFWWGTTAPPPWVMRRSYNPAAKLVFDGGQSVRRLPWLRTRQTHGSIWPVGRSVHPWPVDRNEVRRRLADRWGIPSHSRLIVCSAPLIPATRLKDLIWALDLLLCTRDDLHLLVLGDGPQRNQLQRFAECTDARQRVIFAGEPADGLDIVAAADVFWHSHLKQHLPDALLWALAQGVPCVAAWGPATQTAVCHQQTALGAELGRRDQFARWTKYILEQTASAKLMAQQAQSWMAARFSPEPAAAAIASAYESLCD